MAAVDAPLKKPLILVADDDVMVRMLARECLEAEGMEVVEAEQAMQAYRHERPDLIFLDVDMPLKSGIQVCEEIRQTPAGETVPILIATGAEDRDTIDRGFNAGATQYKTKPVNWSLLGRDIRYMLRAAQAFNDLKAQEDRLRHLAALPNRRSFVDQLQRGVADSEGTHSLGLIMINIDQFKRINDSIGHERGDDLLCRFAARLSTYVREMEQSRRAASESDYE